MNSYDFSNVEVAVIDCQTSTLRLLRDVLARLGLKKVSLYDSVSHAATLLSAGSPDVLLVDCDGPHEADAFRFIRSFRNEPETPNPYAAIIVTTWQATPAQLTKAANSGADDLISKPLSPKQLQERFNLLVEARKKFVVTADYIGPDRRKSPREGAQIPLIDAPNTLRMKALGRWPAGNVKDLFDLAGKQVNHQKRLRGAIQIAFLLEYAAPDLTESPPSKIAIEHLARAPGIVDDIMRRMNGAPNFGETENLCRAIKTAAEKLCVAAHKGAAAAADAIGELQLLVDNLMRAVDPNRTLADMKQEVAVAVAGYRSRLAQLSQAKQGGAGGTKNDLKPKT